MGARIVRSLEGGTHPISLDKSNESTVHTAVLVSTSEIRTSGGVYEARTCGFTGACHDTKKTAKNTASFSSLLASAGIPTTYVGAVLPA